METHNLENNPKRYGEAEEVHHIRGEVVVNGLHDEGSFTRSAISKSYGFF